MRFGMSLLFKVAISLLIGSGAIVIWNTKGVWGFMLGVGCMALGLILVDLYSEIKTSKYNEESE